MLFAPTLSLSVFCAGILLEEAKLVTLSPLTYNLILSPAVPSVKSIIYTTWYQAETSLYFALVFKFVAVLSAAPREFDE